MNRADYLKFLRDVFVAGVLAVAAEEGARCAYGTDHPRPVVEPPACNVLLAEYPSKTTCEHVSAPFTGLLVL